MELINFIVISVNFIIRVVCIEDRELKKGI